MSITVKFVLRAYSLEDVQSGRNPTTERESTVEKNIDLGKTEYENFITDFCVERDFIEENMHLCGIDKSDVWHCLLVRQKGLPGGVLVMPHGSRLPKWTAVLPE